MKKHFRKIKFAYLIVEVKSKSNHLFYPWIVSSQSWYVHVNTRLKTNYQGKDSRKWKIVYKLDNRLSIHQVDLSTLTPRNDDFVIGLIVPGFQMKVNIFWNKITRTSIVAWFLKIPFGKLSSPIHLLFLASLIICRTSDYKISGFRYIIIPDKTWYNWDIVSVHFNISSCMGICDTLGRHLSILTYIYFILMCMKTN